MAFSQKYSNIAFGGILNFQKLTNNVFSKILSEFLKNEDFFLNGFKLTNSVDSDIWQILPICKLQYYLQLKLHLEILQYIGKKIQLLIKKKSIPPAPAPPKCCSHILYFFYPYDKKLFPSFLSSFKDYVSFPPLYKPSLICEYLI